MIIYKVTNKINNNSYIGQTAHSISRRKSQHTWDVLKDRDNMYFHKALRKYGKENFDWSVIYECNNKQELNIMEVYFIGYYDTHKNGYNLTIGGEGISGYKLTKKMRQRISDTNKGRIRSEETKKKISIAKKNVPKTEETKKKMSRAKKGIKLPPRTKEHSSNISIGVKKWWQTKKEIA